MESTRAHGLFAGLVAGDRNGGPTQMAIRVAQSLLERRAFDAADILARYLAWWRAGAFDTGPVAARVLALIDAGMPDAAARVDRELGGMTAGCNPMHRATPIAAAAFISDDELAECVRCETQLTHAHPLAAEAAICATRMCRAFVRGATLPEAIAFARSDRLPQIERALDDAIVPGGRDGFAPHVLQSAVHFVAASETFAGALSPALSYAGPANYAPVLVGALAGARWGHSASGDATAAALASTW